MAELRTDFKDDILAESMGGKRRYQMLQNEDGTVSFVDVTEYEQVGSDFGQAEINAINQAVIDLQNDQIETVDPMTTTEEGFAADAKLTGDALRDLSANFTMAADAIGDAISGLGVEVPEGASLLNMAELISSHLYFPVDNQETGVITMNIAATGRTYTGNVEFEKPFLELPNVSLTGDYNSNNWLTGYQVTSKTTTGFSWKFTTYAGDGRTVRIAVSWTATGKRAAI